MANYESILKHPSNSYYSTERLNSFVPFKMINNVNLNTRKIFLSTSNSFKSIYKNLSFNNQERML